MTGRTDTPSHLSTEKTPVARNTKLKSSPPAPLLQSNLSEKTPDHHDDDSSVDRLRLEASIQAKILASRFLRSARERAGLSQNQLAKRLNRAKGYVSQTESLNSDKKVPLNYLVEVAIVTGHHLFVGDPSELTLTEQQRAAAQARIENASAGS